MNFLCEANIVYPVIVQAESADAAALYVFETIGETVIDGVIPTDLFENGTGSGLRYPFLDNVDVKEVV